MRGRDRRVGGHDRTRVETRSLGNAVTSGVGLRDRVQAVVHAYEAALVAPAPREP
jgi:hypothetical protein